MGSTYTALTYHLIFSTKYRQKIILPAYQERLYEYIGGIIRQKDGILLQIGGVEDHIHIMAGIAPKVCVSDMVKFIKSNSSLWMNQTFGNEIKRKFSWQPGYGAFTVSHSNRDQVGNYIQNQAEHHRVKSYQEEFLTFLAAHGIEYDPKFVFEQEHHG